MSPDERRAEKMRQASLMMAAYLAARKKMTPRDATAAAIRWVATYNAYMDSCARRE